MGYASFLYRQLCVHPPPIPPTLSLTGQTILITGSNSGIGLSAASQCVSLNAATILLAVRSLSKGEEAKASILQSNPNTKTNIEVWLLDMESFSSILAFGKKVNELKRLDVVILNAGVFKTAWDVSGDGYESSLQVNHLSTALLSLLVLPVLRKTSIQLKKSTRLTFTSSEVHMWTPFKEQSAPHILELVNTESNFIPGLPNYSVSKLLNVFWIREFVAQLDKRQSQHASTDGDLIVNFFNPGSVKTGLHRDTKALQIFDAIIGWTVEEGGRLVIDAAFVKGKETHGCYLSEAKVIEYVFPHENRNDEENGMD